MDPVPKYPPLRSPTPPPIIHLPPPSGYLKRVPAYSTSEEAPRSRSHRRRRLVLWFAVAVALHGALLLGIWLMPALRIPWEPSPQAWVQVVSVPAAPPKTPRP